MDWNLSSHTDASVAVSLTETAEGLQVVIRYADGEGWHGSGSLEPDGEGIVRAGVWNHRFFAVRTAEGVEVWIDGEVYSVRIAGRVTAATAGTDTVLAPMPGMVVKIAAEVGQEVAEGDPLLVLESMKMQLTLSAPIAGRVAELNAAMGRMVDQGALLARIEAVKS